MEVQRLVVVGGECWRSHVGDSRVDVTSVSAAHRRTLSRAHFQDRPHAQQVRQATAVKVSCRQGCGFYRAVEEAPTTNAAGAKPFVNAPHNSKGPLRVLVAHCLSPSAHNAGGTLCRCKWVNKRLLS